MFQENHKPEPSGDEVPLAALKKNESGIVARLNTEDNKDLQKLLAMGILPGRSLRVLQRYPVYILEVERTQVAMDKELARLILLKR